MMNFLRLFRKKKQIPKHPDVVIKEITWEKPHPIDSTGKKPQKVMCPNGLVFYSTWYKHPWMDSSGKIRKHLSDGSTKLTAHQEQVMYDQLMKEKNATNKEVQEETHPPRQVQKFPGSAGSQEAA